MRDLELIRNLLLAIKREETAFDQPLNKTMLGFPELDDSLYYSHLILLNEASLIETQEEKFDHQVILQPTHLTLNGRQFLKNIQNDKIWKKLLVLDSKVSTSMDLILMAPLAEHYAQDSKNLRL